MAAISTELVVTIDLESRETLERLIAATERLAAILERAADQKDKEQAAQKKKYIGEKDAS